MAQANKLLSRQRAEQVIKLKLAGATFPDIREFAQRDDPEAGTPWLGPSGKPLSDRQLWRIVGVADDLYAASLEKDREKLVAHHVLLRRLIRARSLEQGDNRTALAAAADECRLLGLYPEQARPKEPGQQINIWGPVLAQMSNEQLAALASLAEKALNGATHVDTRGPSEAPIEAAFTPAAGTGGDFAGSLPPQLPDLCEQDADPV
jgi:hypothetical protein